MYLYPHAWLEINVNLGLKMSLFFPYIITFHNFSLTLSLIILHNSPDTEKQFPTFLTQPPACVTDGSV